eukprot:gene5618-biopygen2795
MAWGSFSPFCVGDRSSQPQVIPYDPRMRRLGRRWFPGLPPYCSKPMVGSSGRRARSSVSAPLTTVAIPISFSDAPPTSPPLRPGNGGIPLFPWCRELRRSYSRKLLTKLTQDLQALRGRAGCSQPVAVLGDGADDLRPGGPRRGGGECDGEVRLPLPHRRRVGLELREPAVAGAVDRLQHRLLLVPSGFDHVADVVADHRVDAPLPLQGAGIVVAVLVPPRPGR